MKCKRQRENSRRTRDKYLVTYMGTPIRLTIILITNLTGQERIKWYIQVLKEKETHTKNTKEGYYTQ